MSKNKNYTSYYNGGSSENDKREETKTLEEADSTIQETPQEEIPKVEEPVKEVFKPLKTFAKVIGGKRVNMRYKPTRASQPINIIPCGAKVIVEREEGEWWKCTYKGITGYMMSEFLKKE